MATRVVTKSTRERIAACAVHGLYYWSDHCEKSMLWATDDSQTWREVRIDARRGTSYYNGKAARYTVADDLAGIAFQLGYRPTDEPVVSQPAPARRPRRSKPVEMAAVVTRSREVVLAAIAHDPDHLGRFTTDELTDALDHSPHSEAIRAELDSRHEAAS